MFTGKGKRHNRRPVLGALASALGIVVLLVALGLPETALGSVLGYTRLTSLNGAATLQYTREWDDVGSGQRFSQHYSLGITGFYIDPRLVKFNAGAKLKYDINKGSFGDENDWLTGAHLRISMLNRINRDRGLRLWRYLPSNVRIGYRYVVTNTYNQNSYDFSFVVVRPGYIRFFGPKGIIYYDDGKRKVTLNANRYRKKFYDGTLNYNRYGNGNWNRNGNGNWNRNGNGNWNRNGNGNWNRNGNGNWNANGNANGNWNANSNARFRQQAPRRQPVGFRFPSIFYNLHGARVEYKNRPEPSELLVSSLRAFTRTWIRDGQGRRAYSSHYLFSHYYYENNKQGSMTRMRLQAQNEWRRLYLSNWYKKQKDIYSVETAQAQSRLRWNDAIGPYLSYNLGLGGNYRERSGSSSTSYSMNGGINSSVSKAVRLSPRLTSVSTMRGTYTAFASRVDDGETLTSDSWGVRASELLDSTHIRWLLLYARVDTGYSERGVPLSLTLGSHTRGLQKLTVSSHYSYSTFFPSGGGSRRVTQKLDFKADYVFRYNLDGYLEVDRKWTEEKNAGGNTDNWGSTNYNAGMSWRPTHSSMLKAKSNNSVSDDGNEMHLFTSLYKLGLRRGSNFTASLDWKWQDDFGKKKETLILAYDWKYRRLSFMAEYTRKTSGEGAAWNRIILRVTRTFGRRLRM